MRRLPLLLLSTVAATPALAGPPPPTPDEAKAFVAKVNQDLRKLTVEQATADWIKNTYITDDTERNAATADAAFSGYVADAIHTATRFDVLKLDPATSRSLYLLKMSAIPLPSPNDPKKREELATIASKLDGMYGKGKYCKKDKNSKEEKCLNLDQIEDVLEKSHDYNELLDVWRGWHAVGAPMRPMYQREVELANQGAKDIGVANVGDLWRSAYDMPPADFEKEVDRLWLQVKPLYEQLHCYVRAKLQKQYGKDKIPDGGPIPAHLLGNMWAQEWENIYPLVEPYQGQPSLDVTSSLVKQKYDAVKLAKLSESFFTSLGLDALPATFWERSMLTRPRDREVVCHASAWDVTLDNDVRIKMCIEIKERDLVTLHHEMGHDYYYHYYDQLPVLFQGGANDGFHEAIGDALVLSITPSYLKKVGLVDQVPSDEKGLINVQLKRALSKVAFLPFGLLIDKWRWDVFSGKTPPSRYNQAWWTLRRSYQGVSAPVTRDEKDFDPGAKYHVPGNTPYMRYFLADILQFQFHRGMCKAAGFKGPLHECSIYGNKEAGKRLKAMLQMAATKPWPDALEVLTGERQMDAGAILEYFAPLQKWLEEQNKGQKCGWK